MGWFDEQIRMRKQKDEKAFSDAFLGLASVVMGKKAAAARMRRSGRTARSKRSCGITAPTQGAGSFPGAWRAFPTRWNGCFVPPGS